MRHSPSQNGKRSAGQEITHLLWTPKVNHHVYKSPPPDPTYSQMNLAAHINTLFLSDPLSSHKDRGFQGVFFFVGFRLQYCMYSILVVTTISLLHFSSSFTANKWRLFNKFYVTEPSGEARAILTAYFFSMHYSFCITMWKYDRRGTTPCSLVGISATFENFWALLSTLHSGSKFFRNFRPVIRRHILEDGILQEGDIFIQSVVVVIHIQVALQVTIVPYTYIHS